MDRIESMSMVRAYPGSWAGHRLQMVSEGTNVLPVSGSQAGEAAENLE
jgi:hypothetical protein